MKFLVWDEAQNATRRKARGVVFEDAVFHIERGDLLDILEYPHADRHPDQRVLVVRQDRQVYLVPFSEDDHSVFLKTIIPTRKATKQYLGGKTDNEA